MTKMLCVGNRPEKSLFEQVATMQFDSKFLTLFPVTDLAQFINSFLQIVKVKPGVFFLYLAAMRSGVTNEPFDLTTEEVLYERGFVFESKLL